MLKKKLSVKTLLLLAVVIFCLYSTAINFFVVKKFNSDNSLVLLAYQFVHKHISLKPTTTMPLGDISKYGGRYYIYFGLFPSIALIPLVEIFGQNFLQSFLGIFSITVSFFAVYSISRYFKFGIEDSTWLSVFFVFSTVLLGSGIINITAYQVEVFAVPFVLLSLREYFLKKRSFLIGLFLGLAILTRATIVLASLFFLFEFLQKRLNAKQLFFIFIPIILSLIITGAYNYVRFHNVLESGYSYNITWHSYPLSLKLRYGYMCFYHLPANLYSFLILPPQPLLEDAKGFVLKFPYLKVNPWGIAVWFTSPLFLALLYKFKKGIFTISALFTAIALCMPVFLYYSIGFAQFGYRYALDFLPFLLLLLIPSISPKLSSREIFLIIIGVVFNAVYLGSPWGAYPILGIFN